MVVDHADDAVNLRDGDGSSSGDDGDDGDGSSSGDDGDDGDGSSSGDDGDDGDQSRNISIHSLVRKSNHQFNRVDKQSMSHPCDGVHGNKDKSKQTHKQASN